MSLEHYVVPEVKECGEKKKRKEVGIWKGTGAKLKDLPMDKV